MHMRQAITGVAVVLLASGSALTSGCDFPGFSDKASGAGHTWTIIPQEGVRACFMGDKGVLEGKGPTPLYFFSDESKDRRLVSLAITPVGDLSEAKAFVLKYMLHMIKGSPPRLAVVLFETDGGAWYKLAGRALTTLDPNRPMPEPNLPAFDPNEPLQEEMPSVESMLGSEVRLPLGSLKRAAFNQDKDGTLERDRIAKAWVGLVLDGPADGGLHIFAAKFTSEPFRPKKPLRLTEGPTGVWTVGKDPAVKATVNTPKEGPGGKPCMTFEFELALGRHMYALPTMQLPDVEIEGYSALRFTYKAVLPKGIEGLLVCLFEGDGSQYCAEPAPPASPDWRTVTIPLDAFRLGGWSTDENDRLDRAQIRSLVIGLHGTANGVSGKGTIRATDIELVP